MSSGMSVYFLSMDTQNEMINTQQKVANAGLQKIQERYAISVMTDKDDNNRLNIQVKNQGPNPIDISDFWIINKTDSVNGYPAQRYLLNYTDSFIPTGFGKNILENKPLYLLPDVYDVKVISALGTIETTEVDVTANNPLAVELIVTPPDVRIGENATLQMIVTNVAGSDITNITPYDPIEVNPSSSVISSQILSISSFDKLRPGDSVFFRWNYQVTGTVGTNVEFIGNATGTMDSISVESNTDSDFITLREPDEPELSEPGCTLAKNGTTE